MGSEPRVTGTSKRPFISGSRVVELGDPDSLFVAGIVRVGIRSLGSVGLNGRTEEVPVGTLRCGEGVAIAVNGLIGSVTETGGHEVIVTVLSVDDTAGGSLSVGEPTKGEIDLSKVVGGGGLGESTHQARLGGKILLGIFKVGGDFFPSILT